ncbi:glycine zipper 2TM domain-containing protein [candidate division KSB3 bacterium]|nr:glycine zipper 2TM domain-containing protein [candidate division KSB3 bacterium]
MKKLVVFAFVLGLVAITAGCGPNYRTQQGAVIGAALGAWAGQDIGRDTESTLIGAAVGGVAGAVIGDAVEQYEADHAYQTPYYNNYQPPQYQQPPRRY